MTHRFTNTEQAIVDLLSDGLPHRRNELVACLSDELSKGTNIHRHLTAIRKHLPKNEGIICQLYRRAYCYRWVKFIS